MMGSEALGINKVVSFSTLPVRLFLECLLVSIYFILFEVLVSLYARCNSVVQLVDHSIYSSIDISKW